jgi:guanylate kinase
VLLDRLRGRGTETRETLKRRLLSALVELQAVQRYQYVVVNDDQNRAAASVSRIIDAEGLRRERLQNVERDVRSIIERLELELDTHSEDH